MVLFCHVLTIHKLSQLFYHALTVCILLCALLSLGIIFYFRLFFLIFAYPTFDYFASEIQCLMSSSNWECFSFVFIIDTCCTSCCTCVAMSIGSRRRLQLVWGSPSPCRLPTRSSLCTNHSFFNLFMNSIALYVGFCCCKNCWDSRQHVVKEAACIDCKTISVKTPVGGPNSYLNFVC